MKTGIFETEHFEGAYPVIKLFDDNNNDIVVFTYEKPYEQFKHLLAGRFDKYEWIVKPGSSSKYSFIWKMYKHVKKRKLDVLYMNGVTNNYIFYALMILFLGKVRVIFTIHGINSYFELKKPFTFRKLIRYTGRKMLLSVVKEFNVVSLTMVSHLQNKLPAHKKVHCIPGAIFERTPENSLSSSRPMHVVIPGSIDGRRRDYMKAIELILLLEEKKIQATFTLLGWFYGQYGKEILRQLQNLDAKFVALKYYDPTSDIVEQPEFDRVMDEADIVFLPAVIKTVIEDDVPEIYGVSICSGTLFDVIKHAKPFIIPQELSIDPFLEKSCIRYTALTDIVEIFSAIQHDFSVYDKLRLAAYEASQCYTVEKVKQRNTGVF